VLQYRQTDSDARAIRQRLCMFVTPALNKAVTLGARMSECRRSRRKRRGPDHATEWLMGRTSAEMDHVAGLQRDLISALE